MKCFISDTTHVCNVIVVVFEDIRGLKTCSGGAEPVQPSGTI